MPTIHRSYEVLIEETVTTENRQRRKHGTDKESRFNTKTAVALELTNEMFQDAVCYYTLMLTGMVKDERWTEETIGYAQWMKGKLGDKGWQARLKQLREQQRPINPLWEHITKSPEMCAATADVVKRLAENYPYAIFHRSKDAEGLVRAAFCYQGEERLPDSTRREKRRQQPPSQAALIRTFVQNLMVEAVKVTGKTDALNDMASFAGVWSGHLCSPAGRSRPKGTGVYERLHAELREFVNKSDCGRHWNECKQELTAAVQAKDSADNRKRLRAVVEQARGSVLGEPSLLTAVCNRVQELAGSRAIGNTKTDAEELQAAIADTLRSPDRKPTDTDDLLREKVRKDFERKATNARETALGAFRRAFNQPRNVATLKLAPHLPSLRTELAATKTDDPRLQRLQERNKKDAGEFMELLCRLRWVSDRDNLRELAAADVLAFVIDNDPPETADSKLPYQVAGAEPLFPFFTNSLGIPIEDQVVWDEFDTAAFKRASEAVFKYAIITAERRRKIEGLKAEVDAFESKGRLSEKKNKDGTPRYAFFGMEGDKRRACMETLLHELGKDRASGESGYGLRYSTIGGWPYLRPELLKAYEQGRKDKVTDTVLEGRLLDVVDEVRSKSGGGFGSADFFYALCQTENYVLWLEEWPDRQAWHAPDFVAHYARFSKKHEDLQGIADEKADWKPKAINYTWPGQPHLRKRERSFRPFDFKCDIRTDPQIDLLARDEASEQIRRVTTNKAARGKTAEFPLTLSFRRLKRDRITDAAGNSVEAFFAPPKLAAKDAPPPPVLAGPRVRPDDIKARELDAFLDDLSKKLERAKLLDGISNALAQHHREILRMIAESQTSAKAEALLRRERSATIALLCKELNRLIESNQSLYKKDDLSKSEQKCIADNPGGLEHRRQNRKAIEQILGGFLKRGASCYNEAVSLLAPKRAGGAFHFMFAVEIDDMELAAFRVPRVSGDQPFQDAKQGETWVHAHLRWPVDLNTETERRKRKEEKAKERGEDVPSAEEDEEGAGKRPSLPKREELWCASNNLETPVHALFVDLGVRFAGAWSRARIRKSAGVKPDTAHVISPPVGHPDHEAEIWCEFYGQEGTFRLQGEDAKVWHRPKDGCHDKQDSRFSRQEVPQIGEDGKSQWPDAGTAKDGWRFGRELYGSRGRLAASEETTNFKELAEALFPATNRFPLPQENSDVARFIPAMAEHLVARLDRRLGRINFLFNLRWRLEGSKEQDATTRQFTRDREPVEQAQHYRVVVESLAPATLHPQPDDAEKLAWNDELRSALTANWDGLDGLLKKPKRAEERREHEKKWAGVIATDPRWQWKQLADKVHTQLKRLVDELGVAGESGMVAQIARFAWPLRDKCWHWRKYTVQPSGIPCPSLLSTEPLPANSENRKIIGQGGLNMRRIELLQHLRRCCQSLAKHEERFALGRFPSKKGLEPFIVPRGESVHDPCPSLLEKINELRDQRVDQTAALILAEALGLELMNPAEVTLDGLRKWQLKSQRDIHGRYQKRKIKLDGKEIETLPCSVIVVEDLSRYLTSQDRSRFENRRLMEWSHRQVIKKLKDMAQVFGIEIVAVDARYSSRFCSKTHVPGIRVAEVKRGFEQEHPWRKWRDEKFNGKLTKRAERVREIAKRFEKNADATLLIEMEGGPLFLACNGRDPVNADINASKNIGFRALAHPDLWEFFPVIRTETAGEGKLRVINRRGVLAALKPDDTKREFAPTEQKPKKKGANGATGDDENETSERPYLFVTGTPGKSALLPDANEDVYNVSPTNNGVAYRTARGGLFWRRVAEKCRERIDEINTDRLKKPKPE
jgi:IS605 OrfB family transposase